jgi:hypothetical protein
MYQYQYVRQELHQHFPELWPARFVFHQLWLLRQLARILKAQLLTQQLQR